jgi:alpha-ketoglutarate-dependent taurine dioxygenase
VRRLAKVRRKLLSIGPDDLVAGGGPEGEGTLPALVRPVVDGLDLAGWVSENEERVASWLRRSGAILFRGFGPRSPESFESFIRGVAGEPLAYRERSTPRRPIAGKIYSSTEYPPSESIFLHNENSYQTSFPLKLFFYCAEAPSMGGQTPLADTRKVYQRIPPRIRERFTENGVRYVRNLSGNVGLPWQEVFQTEDRSEVMAYCARRGITTEWKPSGGLRLSSVLPPIVIHPVTGEHVWFNHAAFFHVSTLPPSLRMAIEDAFEKEDYPANTYYGDGAPIEPSVLDELRNAYLDEKVAFAWEEGDLLMLDNLLTAHAREPFEGPRRIWTGMAEPATRRGMRVVVEEEGGNG